MGGPHFFLINIESGVKIFSGTSNPPLAKAIAKTSALNSENAPSVHSRMARRSSKSRKTFVAKMFSSSNPPVRPPIII